jgi:hypothetical protein
MVSSTASSGFDGATLLQPLPRLSNDVKRVFLTRISDISYITIIKYHTVEFELCLAWYLVERNVAIGTALRFNIRQRSCMN